MQATVSLSRVSQVVSGCVVVSLLWASSTAWPANRPSPPDSFLNRSVGVIYGPGFNDIGMTVKQFLDAAQAESKSWEPANKGQWICRLSNTDKLTRLSHEMSILFAEISEPNMALIARIALDGAEFNDKDKLGIVMAIAFEFSKNHKGNSFSEVTEQNSISSTPQKDIQKERVSVPAVKAPQTTLKTSGSSGTNPFWARVEAIIRSQWEPPPIDVSGSSYTAVVKFRFFRNGTVKEVGIQQTSGNSYFDDAGRRAVLKPRQYPQFPAEMTEPYQDVEMIFSTAE